MSGIGRPLPKFGEWDVNDPSSAEGYTVIFEKARDEKKTGGNAQGSDSPRKENKEDKIGTSTPKFISKNWLCCVRPSHAES